MNPLSYILLTACLLNGFLASVCLKYRKSPGAKEFALVLLTIILYSLGYAFELNSDTLSESIFWLKIEYLGIPFFPTFLLIFAIRFVEQPHWLKPWLIIVLISISALNLIIHYTNSYTHWFYTAISIDNSGPYTIVKLTKGFWYWIHQGYSILSMAAFNVLLTTIFWLNDRLKRRQTLIILLSSLPPWVCYLVYITGNSPGGIDLIPFSFSVMGIIFAYGMFKYKLFDIAPLALENVFEHMEDGVIIVDQSGRVLRYNKAALNDFTVLTQYDTGFSINIMKEKYAGLTEIIDGRKPSGNELELKDDKGIRYYEVNVSEIFNKKGTLIGKTIIFRNITDRKQSEQLILNNQEYLFKLNQTKDKLLSIIGHDLRGSIGNIKNLISIINELINKQCDERTKHLGSVVEKGTAQVQKLLENLLLWAKSQSGAIHFSPETFNLYQLVNEIDTLLGPLLLEKQITLHNNVESYFVVNADYQMISTILRNLISNSIKFTHKGGNIYITAVSSEKVVTIRVRDTGIGIPEEVIGKLFSISTERRLGTEKEFGSGLGLILCKEFVDRHYGNIGVESTSDKGTVLFFTIPLDFNDNHNPPEYNHN